MSKESPRTYRVRSWRRRGIDLTYDRYLEMIAEQGNRCAICNRQSRNQALAVDHNHKTGQVRGLLCAYCNGKLLKYLRDSQPLAIGLANYLNRWFNKETK